MEGKAPKQGETADWAQNLRGWYAYMDYGNWLGVDNWVQNVETPTPSKGKGGFLNGGNQNPMGRAPMTDPGGKVYQDSDWALKTNGGI